MSTTLSNIGNRLWDATQIVGDFLSGGKRAEVRGGKVAENIDLGKSEVTKRAELRAEDFLPISSLLAANRDSLSAQRNKEVARIQALPQTLAKSGAGALAFGNTGAGQVSSKMPEEIPPTPTAFQLAKQLSNQEVVEELLKKGVVQPRNGGVAKGVIRGINRGITLGMFGQRDMEDPYTQAQLKQDPMTKSEQAAEVVGEIAGSFVPYAGIAKVVGSSFRTVSAINRFAVKNPFLFGAAVSNVGEELVDMGIRKGTGQAYNQNDFILGLAMGGAFEGVFAGVRSAKNMALIQKQLNIAASKLEAPSPKALYETVKDQVVDGMDITYESLFKEHRLAFFRQEGRPGIDRPATPPTPQEKATGLLGGGGDNMPRTGGSDSVPKQLTHQTSLENVSKIKKEGFSLDYGKARLSDNRIPDGVYLKSNDIDIGLGSTDKAGVGQLKVKIPDGKTLEVKNMQELNNILGEHDDFLLPSTEATRIDVSSARGFDALEKRFKAASFDEAKIIAKEYGIDVEKLVPIRGDKLGKIDIELATEQSLLDKATELGNSKSALARKAAAKILKDKGYDYVHIAEDVGSFGRKTDNFIVLPHKIKELNEFNLFSPSPLPSVGGKMDQGTMLPNVMGESRMPGLKGDDNLKNDKVIKANAKYAKEIVQPYVEQYLKFKRSIKAGMDIGEEGIGGISGGDFASGQALRKQMEFLKSRGVFKFKNINDVGALDADGAYKLLTEAWEYHQGKPAQTLIGNKRPTGMETFSDDGSALFEEGYRTGQENNPRNLVDNFREMIDEGYEGLSIETKDFDGEGTSVRQLLYDLEQAAIRRSEKSEATRAAKRANAESKAVSFVDEGIRQEASIRRVEEPKHNDIFQPEQAKAFTKPQKTEADIEIMFEPSMRTHLRDFTNKALNSRYISSFGEEGKAIADMIDKADEISNIKVGIDIDELTPILKSMNDTELQRFPDIAEGKIDPETPNEKALLDFWVGRRTEIADQAQRSGLTVRGTDGTDRPFIPRDNYYPRMINEAKMKEIKSDPIKANRMFQSMVDKSNGKIGSITEAKKIFNNIIKDRLQKRYGNLERAREVDFLPEDMLIRDPRLVLSSYLQGARKRVADAQILGPKQENAIRFIENARVQGKDADTMLSLLRRATGEEVFSIGETKLSRLARTYNNLTKLSLAAVTNIGDIVKPFVRTGEFVTTLRGIVKSFTAEGATQARRSGAVEANLRALLQDAGDTKLSDAFFKYTGFTFTENNIRAFNANAAVAHAEALVKRLKSNPDNAFAYRRLAQWLDDPEAAISRGFLTQAEKDIVGFRGIADTQPIRRLDIPFYWQRPGVKVLTQFKTFAYKHMVFMKKFVVDEAMQGNVRPLIAFLIMGQVVGESVGDMKAAIRNRERPDDVTRRIIDNYMTIGGVGLATDFLANMQYGSLGGGFLKFVAGPTLTDVDDWITRIVSTNRVDRVPKKIIGSIPLVGPAAAQNLYPSKNTYNAKTIPIAEDILDLLQPSGGASSPRSPNFRVNPSRRSNTRVNPYR